MNISFNSNNQMLVEMTVEQTASLQRVNENWPHLISEVLVMLIKNRERQLERIEVTKEIKARKEKK